MIQAAEGYGVFSQEGGFTILEWVFLIENFYLCSFQSCFAFFPTLHIVLHPPYPPFLFHFHFSSKVSSYYFLFLFI